MNKTITLSLLMIGMFGWSAASSASVILFSDDFTVPASKSLGDDVRFNEVQKGRLAIGRKYSGQNAIVYGSDGSNGFFSSAADSVQSRKIYLPLSKADLPEGFSTLRCEITLDADNMGSLQVGFSDAAKGVGKPLQKNGQIWFDVKTGKGGVTNYALMCGDKKIASGSVEGGGPLQYVIEYDFASNTIPTASVKGKAVVTGFDLGGIGFTPDIQCFQMQFGSIKPEAKGTLVGDDLLVTAVR